MGWFSKKEEPPEEPVAPPTAVEQAQAAAAALQEQAGALFTTWMGGQAAAEVSPKKKSKKAPPVEVAPVVVKKIVPVKTAPTTAKVVPKSIPKSVPKIAPKNVPKIAPKVAAKNIVAPKIPAKNVAAPRSIPVIVSSLPASSEDEEEPEPLPPRQRPAGVVLAKSLQELVGEIPPSKGEEEYLLAQREFFLKSSHHSALLPFTTVREPRTKLHPLVLPRKGVTAGGDVDGDQQLTGLVDAETFFKKSNIDKVIASKEFVDAMKREVRKGTRPIEYSGTSNLSSSNQRPLSPGQEPMSTSIPLLPYLHAICQKCGLYKQECICGFGPKNIAPFAPQKVIKTGEIGEVDNTDEGEVQNVRVQPIPQLRRDASLL